MTTRTIISMILLASAVSWYAFIEWLRYRSFQGTRHTGFSPGTKGLSLLGSVGGFALVVAAVLVRLVAH